MSNSSLVSYTKLSPNHYWNRKGFVTDRITPHYVAGNATVETLGEIFYPVARQASSQYGIESSGRCGQYVDERFGAWTSGSWQNDCRAITIEVSNLADGSITAAAWRTLVALCVDICKRHGFKGVQYTGSTSGQKDGYMLLTKHQWFQSTDCPGPWMTLQFDRLAKEVNAAMGGKTPIVNPANNAMGGKLDVDGKGGYNTVYDMQNCLKTYLDGTISGQWSGNRMNIIGMTSVEWGAQGSMMVKALQGKLGIGNDGIWGRETSKALQRDLMNKGYDVGPDKDDGYFGHDSVCALQNCLNDGRFV